MSRKNKTKKKILNIKDSSLIIPFLISIVFFFVVHMAAGDGIKGMSMFTSIVALILVIVKFKTFASRVRFPFVVMTLYFILCGISTLYAVSGKFAMQEFYKMLVAFNCILVFMSIAPEGKENTGRWMSIFIEGYSFILSLVSIDLISTRLLSTPVVGFISLFSGAFSDLKGVESGVRILSISGTPNVYAAISSVGILITLGLIKNSVSKKERNIHIASLFVQTMGFLLTFSMGATAALVIAFVVYMFIENKEKKVSQVSLMIFVVVVCVALAMIISQTSFSPWDGFDIVPLLLTIVGAGIVCVVDYFFGEKVYMFFASKKKFTTIGLVSIVAFVFVFIILAVNITGPATVGKSPALRRASYPQPGEYTIDYESNKPITIKIMSQNKEETIMHTETIIYSGSADGAKFVVPDDSLVVYFEVRSNETATVKRVSYVSADGKKTDLPLKYYLLPSFMSNRIQGIFANENVIQRTVFWEDGMKLFAKNPIFGRGLGGYQNGIIGVQSFFYETKYAHNHYVEALADTGIVGLLLFVSSLVVSFIAVIRELRKKEEGHSLAPVLLVAMVFITLHAAFEVNFSYYSFIPIGWLVVAMISTCCDSFPLNLKDIFKKITAVVCLVFVLVFTVLMGMNISAENTSNNEKTLTGLQKAISKDPFEWADHMASYVHSVTRVEVSDKINQQAMEYAERLSKLDSNSVPIILARFYFSRNMVDEGFDMIYKYVMYSAAYAQKWNDSYIAIDSYYQAILSDKDKKQQYEEKTIWISNTMTEWNSTHMGRITVDANSVRVITTAYLSYAETFLSDSDSRGFEILKQYVNCLVNKSDMTRVEELLEKYTDKFESGVVVNLIEELKATAGK